MTNTKLIFAVKTTTDDGKEHAAGSTASVPAAEARALVHRGRARLDDGTASAPAKKAPAKKTAAKKKAEPPKSDAQQPDANQGDGNTPEGDQS